MKMEGELSSEAKILLKHILMQASVVVILAGCWIDANLNSLNDAAFSRDFERVKSLHPAVQTQMEKLLGKHHCGMRFVVDIPKKSRSFCKGTNSKA